MSSLFAVLGRVSIRYRWFVVAAWIGGTVAAAAFLPSLAAAVNNNKTQFLPASAPSNVASRLAAPFYGASNNERGWWDNHRAIDLGYRPTGRAEDFREHAFAEQAKLKPDPVGDFYQGGSFCGMEFDGDKSRIIDLK